MWGWIPQYGHAVFFWATLVAAVFGGIGIGAAFISAMVAYELSEWATRDANERIAKAEASARADADAKISVAREESRVAIEKTVAEVVIARKETAEANARAKQAELETQRLKNPRTISPGALEAELLGKPKGTASILYAKECTDCEWLSYWILADLQAAGWVLTKPAVLPPAPPGAFFSSPAMAQGGQPWGVSVVANNHVEGTPQMVLMGALVKLMGSVGGGTSKELPDGFVRIIVAPRP